jgi:signal transduction histidine kinase
MKAAAFSGSKPMQFLAPRSPRRDASPSLLLGLLLGAWAAVLSGLAAFPLPRRARPAQLAPETTLGAVLDLLPDAKLVVQGGRVVLANQAARRLLAVSSGQPVAALFAGMAPPELARFERPEAADGRTERIVVQLRTAAATPLRAVLGITPLPLPLPSPQPTLLLHVRPEADIAARHLQATEPERDALAALSRSLIELQERERRSIARELHDEIGQCLSAIRVQFAKLQRRVQGDEALQLIASASSLTERTLGRVRSLSLLLHPPQLETLGLEAALRWHIAEQSRLHELPITFVSTLGSVAVDPDVAIAAYRIVQEALSNALRHAQAQAIEVRLQRDGPWLRLAITDDGRGFELERLRAGWAQRPSLGLVSMTERARLLGGQLRAASAYGAGTRIEAQLPWR